MLQVLKENISQKYLKMIKLELIHNMFESIIPRNVEVLGATTCMGTWIIIAET